MNRTLLMFAALLSATPVLVQDSTSIEGVWKIVEWVEDTRTITSVQPSLRIFTKGHYSMRFLQTDQPRPPVVH